MEETLTSIANIIVVTCIVAVIIFSAEIYMIVRAKSIGWLLAAWFYILTWRIIILVEGLSTQHAGWFQQHSAWFLLPFYPMIAIGMWTLMESLRRPLEEE